MGRAAPPGNADRADAEAILGHRLDFAGIEDRGHGPGVRLSRRRLLAIAGGAALALEVGACASRRDADSGQPPCPPPACGRTVCAELFPSEPPEPLAAPRADCVAGPSCQSVPPSGPGIRFVSCPQLFWPRRDLRVSFIGGDPRVHRRIAEHAQEWTRHAKVRFSFVASGGDVRIGFTCTGNWSYVGTEACGIAADKATMNFARLGADSSEADYRFYVLHEFGHALGCVHEHQSPAAGLPWNKPAVYEFYLRCYQWDTARVDRNIFARYDTSQTQFSSWDLMSIMQYPVEAALLLDGHPGIPRNEALSETDRRFIATAYP